MIRIWYINAVYYRIFILKYYSQTQRNATQRATQAVEDATDFAGTAIHPVESHRRTTLATVS